jgi:addiction module HigA family antidote
MPERLIPIHPGEIIREEVLQPLDMSVNQLAKALAMDAARLNEIVRGRRGITADTALRLARYLRTSSQFGLRLQVDYELRVARQSKEKEIARAVQPRFQAQFPLGILSARSTTSMVIGPLSDRSLSPN